MSFSIGSNTIPVGHLAIGSDTVSVSVSVDHCSVDLCGSCPGSLLGSTSLVRANVEVDEQEQVRSQKTTSEEGSLLFTSTSSRVWYVREVGGGEVRIC